MPTKTATTTTDDDDDDGDDTDDDDDVDDDEDDDDDDDDDDEIDEAFNRVMERNKGLFEENEMLWKQNELLKQANQEPKAAEPAPAAGKRKATAAPDLEPLARRQIPLLSRALLRQYLSSMGAPTKGEPSELKARLLELFALNGIDQGDDDGTTNKWYWPGRTVVTVKKVPT